MARSAAAAFAVLVAAGFAGCAATAHGQPAAPPPADAPPSYSDAAPYRFYPGDQIEVEIYSAPELTRTVTVAPDGRVSLPLIEPVSAVNLTANELHDELVAAYAQQLRTPELHVSAKAFGSRLVFVGGEVARPGIYEMPASIDAFQAVTLAGGFLPSARRGEVLVLSRDAAGAADVRAVDLSPRALRNGFPGAQALSRYDVVFVPRSHIAEVNLFMQQYVRDALPVQFGFYYDLNRGNR
ncbi:MAG TPA: polysaccharide biosynthesis/export family protein [Caulobacterales bacterium]|nr:polysaccharide biosynthesis/export family protein [Caulobacterales bacterium]